MPYPQLPAPTGDHPDFFSFNSPGDNVTVRIDEVWSFMSKPFPNNPAPPSEVWAISGVTPEGTPVSVGVGGTGSRHHLYRQFYSAATADRVPLGTWVRITFKGFEGQAKLYAFDVAPAGAIPEPPNSAPPTGTAAVNAWVAAADAAAEAPFGAVDVPPSPWDSAAPPSTPAWG